MPNIAVLFSSDDTQEVPLRDPIETSEFARMIVHLQTGLFQDLTEVQRCDETEPVDYCGGQTQAFEMEADKAFLPTLIVLRLKLVCSVIIIVNMIMVERLLKQKLYLEYNIVMPSANQFMIYTNKRLLFSI